MLEFEFFLTEEYWLGVVAREGLEQLVDVNKTGALFCEEAQGAIHKIERIFD